MQQNKACKYRAASHEQSGLEILLHLARYVTQPRLIKL